MTVTKKWYPVIPILLFKLVNILKSTVEWGRFNVAIKSSQATIFGEQFGLLIIVSSLLLAAGWVRRLTTSRNSEVCNTLINYIVLISDTIHGESFN